MTTKPRSAFPATHRVQFSVAGTMYLFYGSTAEETQRAADKDAAKHLSKGETVWHENWREYIATRPDWINGDYVWHADGNRVRVSRAHVRVDGTGEIGAITETPLRASYRNYDDVIG